MFTGLCLSAVYAFYYLVSKKILYSRISYFLRYVNSGVRDRTLYKYSESFEKVPTMPMVPWFLLGFLVWRIYEVWMLSMNAMSL